MKISRNYLKIFALLFAFSLVFGVISNSLVSYAKVSDLMIGTGSNALMTMELDDSDYSVMPMSSIGTVENTVIWDYTTHMYVGLVNDTDGTTSSVILDSNSFTGNYQGINVHYSAPAGHSIYGYWIWFREPSTDFLPAPGVYRMSLDISSNFSMNYKSCSFWGRRDYTNANSLSSNIYPSYEQSSGDFYIAPFLIRVTNTNYFNFRFDLAENVKNVDFRLAVRFEQASGDPTYTTGGTVNTTQDYENDVSSSLSDLSSSVDTMTDEISGVTEAIQNLQGAMEPHYSNVLTQLHHITEQLHAMYDQIYNNIHLKEYALWQDIKTAIENIDLEVNVNLDKLKTSIDNMSTAIQNKLQSVSDTITGGFDNSGMEQSGNELDSSIQDYEDAESSVIDSVNDSLNDFEFDADLTEYKNIVQMISDFLQELYESSGGLKVVINLSLMLSVASIVIGVYRFKDGG